MRAMQIAVRMRDDLDEVPAEMKRLSAQFTDPAIVSPSAASDAFVKRASVIDGFASSEVGLESAGLSRGDIIRSQAEQRRKSAGGSALEALRAGAAPAADPAAQSGGTEAADIKSKADALGSLIRAGATFESAAQFLGLEGIESSGAVPVSLRVPSSEAGDLEEK